MELDILDFDKTLVPFDSGSLFIFYCIIHYPWCIITLPFIGFMGLLALLKIINFTTFKKFCFCFVPLIPLKKAVKGFWDKHEKEVFPWFSKEKKERKNVIISASPDFLLNEIKDRIGIDTLICTKHSAKSGAIMGENCRGAEKVKRFYEIFNKNDVKVINVYSDSINHDKYIFALATNDCFHIQNGKKVKFKYSDKIIGEN